MTPVQATTTTPSTPTAEVNQVEKNTVKSSLYSATDLTNAVKLLQNEKLNLKITESIITSTIITGLVTLIFDDPILRVFTGAMCVANGINKYYAEKFRSQAVLKLIEAELTLETPPIDIFKKIFTETLLK